MTSVNIVASFTTSPSRIHKCERTIDSILSQDTKPDLILLNIPKKYRGIDKYEIPSFVKDKVTVNIIDDDFGPGTKLIGSILYCEKNDIDAKKFVYFDDDVTYPPSMISCMVMSSVKGTVVGASCFDCFVDGFAGIHFERRRQYQIVEGFAGVCVDAKDLNGFMNYFDSLPKTKEVLRSDDLYLSIFYNKNGLLIRPIDVPNVYSFVDFFTEGRILDYGNNSDALKNDELNNIERYVKAAEQISSVHDILLPNLSYR